VQGETGSALPLKGISLPSRAGSSQAGGTSAADLPDWMLDLADDGAFAETEQAVGVESDNSGYADWLSDLLDEQSQSSESGNEDIDGDVELGLEPDLLPDWLGGQDAAPAAASVDDSAEEELPDWLLSISDQVPASTSTAHAPTGPEPWAASLPDWLAVTDEVGDSSVKSTTPDEGDVLPDWLAGERSEPENRQTANIDQPPLSPSSLFGESFGWTLGEEEAGADRALLEASAEAMISDSDFPEWLAQAQTGEREASAADSGMEAVSIDEDSLELPDWLASMGSSEAMVSDDAGAEALPLPEARASNPEWLSEIVEETPKMSAAVFTAIPQDFEEDPPQPQGPAWLENMGAAGGSASAGVPAFISDEFEEEEPPEEDEAVLAPDWLQGLEVGPSGGPEDLSHVDVALDKADLPPWLQNLRPAEAGGSVPRGDMPDGGALIPADIPDWVQAMRPVPGERGKSARDRIGRATLAEAEGPLVGLPGVLPGLALVDVPAEAKSGADFEIPEVVVKQAQLWQHLLELPRSGERPITQAARGFKANAPVRVIFSLALLLGLFVAILFLPEGANLSQATPLQVAPGAAALFESLERIESGQRVLLAVEYTPAYGDEMDQIARPILEHLDDRQAELVIVSTIPEGTGLGLGLIEDARYEGLVTDAGYLPGNFNGIASFLQTTEARSVSQVIVLTSQSERLRWWIEQVAASDSQQQAQLSLSAGVTASARPLVAPYLQTRGVQGWIAGLSGGLAYREVRGESLTGFLGRTWDVLMLAHWFVAAMLVLGMLYSLVAGKKGAQ
jgi:hypothetical protein